MTNEVAIQESSAQVLSASDFDQLEDALSAASARLGVVQTNYLKFSGKTGEYSYGQSYSRTLAPGTHLLIDPMEIYEGYICWVDGDPVDEQMALAISRDTIKESDLKDHGPYATYSDGSTDGWQKQVSIKLKNTANGETFILKLSSQSGTSAVAALITDFAAQRRQHISKDGSQLYPVIANDVDSFVSKKNKKAGKIYKPIFPIVDWVDPLAAVVPGSDGENPADYAKDITDEAEIITPDDKADKPERSNRRF